MARYAYFGQPDDQRRNTTPSKTPVDTPHTPGQARVLAENEARRQRSAVKTCLSLAAKVIHTHSSPTYSTAPFLDLVP